MTVTYYGYKIWNHDKIQIVMVVPEDGLAFLRQSMTKDVVDYSGTIEQLLCGSLKASSLEDAWESMNDGALSDDVLPSIKPVPMSGGYPWPLRNFQRTVSRHA